MMTHCIYLIDQVSCKQSYCCIQHFVKKWDKNLVKVSLTYKDYQCLSKLARLEVILISVTEYLKRMKKNKTKYNKNS